MPEALSIQYCNLSRENVRKAAIWHKRAEINSMKHNKDDNLEQNSEKFTDKFPEKITKT